MTIAITNETFIRFAVKNETFEAYQQITFYRAQSLRR